MSGNNSRHTILNDIATLCLQHGLRGADIDHMIAKLQSDQKSPPLATPSFPPIEKPAHTTQSHARSNKSQTDFLVGLLGNLGGILVLAGFLIFISMQWPHIGSFNRVLLSLGAGLACLAAAIAAQKNQFLSNAATKLWLLSFAFIPTGLFVVLREYASGDDAILGGVIVFGLCTAIYFLCWFSQRIQILLAAALLFGYAFLGTFYEHIGLNRPFMWLPTGLAMLALGWHFYTKAPKLRGISNLPFALGAITVSGSAYYFWGNHPVFDILMVPLILSMVYGAYRLDLKFFIAVSVVLFVLLMGKYYGFCWGYRDSDHLRLSAAIGGISTTLMGHWLHTKKRLSCSSLWVFFGSMLVYSAFMGMWYKTSSDIFFSALPVIGLAFSARIQSRALLVSSVLALLSFIGYFSARYFADTIGWPITLMLSGAALIGICILALRLDKSFQPSSGAR